jgi:hypothetical protein
VNPTARKAFIAELRALNDQHRYAETIERVTARGACLGRSDRWADAVTWFADRRDEQAGGADITDEWIARQGMYVLEGATA